VLLCVTAASPLKAAGCKPAAPTPTPFPHLSIPQAQSPDGTPHFLKRFSDKDSLFLGSCAALSDLLLEVQHLSFLKPEHKQELTITPLGDTGAALRYSYQIIPCCAGMRWQHGICSLPLSTFPAFTPFRLKMQFFVFPEIIHRTVWGIGRWESCNADTPRSTDRASTCPLQGLW